MTCHQHVNSLPMVVNSDTIMYMCMEVIICHTHRSPGRLMICQTLSIGGTSNHLSWEWNVEETLPAFGVSFAKPFLLKIGYS